jgi:prophage regulatory protein
MNNTTKPLTYPGRVVDSILGIGRSTRYSWQDPKSPQYDPSWPLPIKLSARSIGYHVHEVEAWLASRPRTRLIEKAEVQ